MDNWKNKLTPLDKNKKFWGWCVAISVVLLVIIIAIDTWNDGCSPSIGWLNYVCNISESLVTAVLGVFLLNIVYNLSEIHTITKISEVSYGDMLPLILSSLEKYDGRYRKDENIHVKISKYHDKKKDNYFRITLQYQYLTNVSHLSEFKFLFIRTKSNVNDVTTGIRDNYVNCDFLWGNDETAFPDSNIQDGDYCLRNLIIAGTPIVNLQSYKIVQNSLDDSRVEISYNIPINLVSTISSASEVQLTYRVEFPLCKEDILLITHEFPTQNAQIIFDDSEVADQITVYSMPITGISEAVSPNCSSPELHDISYSISGWIMPKQSYFFGWWKK